ncbi:MAG TPA: acetylornithine deacetylase [Bryobacteraceae bacterium]|jgi:acetylornithine deacetylase|nr:acetylornithine deacetylase [Bryobacteraceae bacterium]
MKLEVEILRELVTIPSVSWMSNQPVIDYVLKRLDPPAWNIKLDPYRDGAGTPKVNLVAITKSRRRSKPELALVCHTDTVPFDPAWKEAINPRVRNGRLYGRGSCDVKGFLACVLASLARLDIGCLSKPLALVLTADEEVGCAGAKHLVRRKAVRARYTIIGEPTGLRPVRAGKGYALAEIVVRGKEAHSAFPAKGRSAILDAARVIASLERIAKKLATRKNRSFDPPFTTLNVGLIQGGTAKNIVPGECRFTVEWRPIPGQNTRWAAELIREEFGRLAHKHPGLDASLDVQRLDPSFHPAATGHLATLLESLTRRRSTTVSFGTEAAHLGPLTTEAIVFGPGDMTTAHKTGEFVPIAELSECTQYLSAVIEKLCANKS